MTSSASSLCAVIVEGDDDLWDAEDCACRMGLEGLMMLLKKLKHKIAQVLVDFDPLIEVINVESHRVCQVFLQSEPVQGLGWTEQLRTSAPKQGLSARAKSFPRHKSSVSKRPQ